MAKLPLKMKKVFAVSICVKTVARANFSISNSIQAHACLTKLFTNYRANFSPRNARVPQTTQGRSETAQPLRLFRKSRSDPRAAASRTAKAGLARGKVNARTGEIGALAGARMQALTRRVFGSGRRSRPRAMTCGTARTAAGPRAAARAGTPSSRAASRSAAPPWSGSWSASGSPCCGWAATSTTRGCCWAASWPAAWPTASAGCPSWPSASTPRAPWPSPSTSFRSSLPVYVLAAPPLLWLAGWEDARLGSGSESIVRA